MLQFIEHVYLSAVTPTRLFQSRRSDSQNLETQLVLVTHSAWTEMECDLICINDLTCTVYKRVSAECFTPLQIKSARIIMSSACKTNRCLDIICIPTLHIIAVQWATATYCLSLRTESNKKQMLVMQGDISTDIQLQLHPRGEAWRHNGLSTADVAF